MCGIVGFTGARAAAPVLLGGLERLEYRGYDSAGIAVLHDGAIQVEKVSGRIAKLREKTEDGARVPGSAGIGHTRWATHGAPTDLNAHPHLSNDGRFAVVHNGIIENYLELRKELIRDGYVFQSETDTETIVHLLEKYYNGDIKTAAEGTELCQKHNLDGFMIGRGVFENPYCFTSHEPTKEELLDLLKLHLDLFDQEKYINFEPLKHYFKIYVRDFPGASELRTAMMDCHSTAEVRAILYS
jgi:glutamate synthase domain-containing protein 1